MIDKLNAIEDKFSFIETQLSIPEIISDKEKYSKLIKEYKNLSPIVSAIRDYKRTLRELDESRQMLDENQDREMRDMILAEIKSLSDDVERLSADIALKMMPKEPNDEKNVIMEIRAGAGGEEAALFAGVLYRMYSMYAQRAGFGIEVMSENETELGGFKEICFSVIGDGAYSKLKYESGVHRVQRVPETEAQGRIQTSTATVAVLPEAEDVEVEIRPEDIKIESCKSSGAGGQHINKTESAIRLTHLPTGIVIECQEERSQFKNKDKAMKLLRTRLFDIKEKEKNDKISSERKNQVGTGDRSERIRTYNYPQGRVTDHRIGKTIYSLDSFLNGNIEDITDALRDHYNAQRLNREDGEENQ
ncbi:MAG: peptide chain release factor 1 [Eubacteriales bacterium]|nr:peptide chain release factor 1 [Eubacteriales bacterium]